MSKYSQIKGKNFAFTLAEVLITLGIIGVVAAITMPTLIHKHQVASLEAGLKRSYSSIVNGFHAIAAEYDGDLRNSGLFDDIDDNTFSERMDEAVKKHFNVVKSCKIGTTGCENYDIQCLANTSNPGCRTYNWFDSANSGRYIAYTNNGMIFSIANAKCIPSQYGNKSTIQYKCAHIVIDTNGKKAPNTRGKDIFSLGILDEKGNIYPATSLEWVKFQKDSINALEDADYWRNVSWQCGRPNIKLKDEDTSLFIIGENCLARIMENGWQMDYLK